MKSFRRVLAIVLLVVAMVSVLAIPASAANDIDWGSKFRNFRQTSTGNYIYGYACAAQSFLLGYNQTSSIISNSGGVDGMFGSETARATKIFQGKCYLAADGIIGPDTWGAMENYMGKSPSGSTTRFVVGSRTAITAKYANSTYNFYYHTTGGSEGGQFHTSY